MWNCYEVSWLDHRGRPRRGAVELRIPCESPSVVESKSLKLYLNSLNFKRFASTEEALATIRRDVASVVGCLAAAKRTDYARTSLLWRAGPAATVL